MATLEHIRGQLLDVLRNLRAMAHEDPGCFEYLTGLIAFYRRPDHACPSRPASMRGAR